jgi:hypothetical protein
MIIITNLLTNMVIVGVLNSLSTNTPKFQEYAFNSMFHQASNMIANWNLDLPRPITTNMVTRFIAKPSVSGYTGTLIFSNRFSFGWDRGWFSTFVDEPYSEIRAKTLDVDANDALFERWMRATNHLTMEKARAIAELVMRSVGIPIRNGKFAKPDYQTQMTYEWKDGKKYPMPFYRFRWDTKDLWYNYEVQVSGITSNVLECYFSISSPYLRSPFPTNYFEMLGLPREPVFVRRMHLVLPGQPPAYEILYDPSLPHKP